MTATVFRNWSIETIRKIIEYISNNETEFEIFKAKNIMSSSIWNNYSNETKRLIEEIIFKITVYMNDKNKYSALMNERIDYSKIVSKNFYYKLFVNCELCNDSHCIPKCTCGDYDLRLNNKNEIFCGSCGEKLNCIECEEGHLINIKELNNINIYLIPNETLDYDIKYFLKKEFELEFNGYISIFNGNIQITEKNIGSLIDPIEVEEFYEICKLDIDDGEKNEQCNNSTKENCNNCKKKFKDCCILQLFSTYKGYRPGPHHGHEFGDLDFKINYKQDEYQFVGIAKSYCNLTHASKEGREMIQQILSATQDKRIEVIGAVCPVRFDTQLEKDLDYIAKCTQSKIVILDDRFMIRQLKHYRNKAETQSRLLQSTQYS